VWDSAIVAAKYAEKWPELFAGKRCCDLSAGCGLVGEFLAAVAAAAAGTLGAPEPVQLQSLQHHVHSTWSAEAAANPWPELWPQPKASRRSGALPFAGPLPFLKLGRI
jgi:hypothetical protein